MTIKETLNADVRQAMKDRDNLKRDTLRMVLAAVKNAEIDKRTELIDTEVLGVLAKVVKQHQDSIEAFKQGGRKDLYEKEEAELAILEQYLPRQLTREEVVAEARKAIEETGAQGPGDKGKVMPKLVAKLKGAADGKLINEVITELLNK